MKRTKSLVFLFDLIAFIAGGLLSAVAIDCFTAPNKIAAGGVTGIATILNYLFGLPIGTMIIVINIPLFAVALRYLGKSFVFNSILATAIVSFSVDFLKPFLPVYTGDRMLAALFGGVIYGAGIGLILMHSGTTGGTELLGKLIQIKSPYIPLGRLIIIIDFVIVVLSTLVYASIESGLYALILIFVISKVVNTMMYGLEEGILVLIITDKNERIAEEIFCKIQRGVTYIKTRGAYTDKSRDALMVAISSSEFSKLNTVINEIDRDAFTIVLPSSQVLGNGFKPIEENRVKQKKKTS